MQVNVVNAVFPSSDQAAAFFGAPDDGPFVMLNLLKFREKAAYPDGSDPDISGAEAYARYAAGVTPLLEKAGGRVRYSAHVAGILLGVVEPMWDMVAMAEYPSLKAFQGMASSPDYARIAHHRVAGLAGQLNIRTRPAVDRL